MLAPHRPPSPSQLRWFGLSLAAVLWIFAALVWWRFSADRWAIWLFGAGTAVGILYYAVPRTQTSIVRGFRLLTLPLQMFVSLILLSLLYFLIITPIGLLMRLIGRDPLLKSIDREATSYWEPAPPAEASSSYFRQY